MPFLANGICFDTTENAFQSWSAQFPIRGFDNAKNTVWVNSMQSHVANLDGTFTYVIRHYDGVNTPILINAGGNFEPCITSAGFDSSMGASFWAFGFTGVLVLYFTSHVIGLVLKKVRNG